MLKKLSAPIIGLLQAVVLVGYTMLVMTAISSAEPSPFIFLPMLCFSVLFSATVVGAYPFWCFFVDKHPKRGMKVVLWTLLGLAVLILLGALLLPGPGSMMME